MIRMTAAAGSWRMKMARGFFGMYCITMDVTVLDRKMSGETEGSTGVWLWELEESLQNKRRRGWFSYL